ncbi:MAG: hypothetical protein HOV94_08715, partial [Saccharothrix sp.]|nr:hypothetical protein [Saccharothrix sp.]
VVELEPVAAEDAIEFLSAFPPRAAGRWEPVLDRLRTAPDSVLVRSLSTPLTINLARAVYTGPDHDPAELADPRRFADPADLTRHLLDSLVTAVYDDPPTPPPRLAPLPSGTTWYPADRARDWLAFLARHATAGDIAWWRLPRPRLVLVPALAGPLCWAAASEGSPVAVGFSIGFAVTWLIGALRRRTPPRRLLLAPVVLGVAFAFLSYRHPSPPGVVAAAWAALALLVVLALATHRPPHRADPRLRGRGKAVVSRAVFALAATTLVTTPGLLLQGFRGTRDWGVPVMLGVMVSVAVGLGAWLTTPPDRLSVPEPGRSLRGDVASTAVWLLAWVVAFQLPLVFVAVALGHRIDLLTVVSALAFGLGTGLGHAVNSASVPYAASLVWWALRGRLPWRLLRFLDDAHRRGVLRRTGAVYQFRHASLRHHLARRDG